MTEKMKEKQSNSPWNKFAWTVGMVAIFFGILWNRPIANPVKNGWLVKAAQDYTGRHDDPKHPLKGVVVVVTGATSGIGEGLAHALYGVGATVVALGRNDKKLSRLTKDLGGDDQERVRTVLFDANDFQSVSDAADEINSKLDRIDFLINNAGMHYGIHTMLNMFSAPASKQGYDEVFQVNYLSHFLLTEKLLPLIRKSSGAVVQVSSAFHWLSDGKSLMSAGNTNSNDAPEASVPSTRFLHKERSYAVSKLAQLLHMHSLQDNAGIQCRAACPAWVGTNIGGDMNALFLKMAGFDSRGHGLSSTLQSMFRPPPSGFSINSATFAFALNEHYTFWGNYAIRDLLAWCAASCLLWFQKLSATPMEGTSSPESLNTTLQESLYRWSKQAVADFL